MSTPAAVPSAPCWRAPWGRPEAASASTAPPSSPPSSRAPPGGGGTVCCRVPATVEAELVRGGNGSDQGSGTVIAAKGWGGRGQPCPGGWSIRWGLRSGGHWQRRRAFSIQSWQHQHHRCLDLRPPPDERRSGRVADDRLPEGPSGGQAGGMPRTAGLQPRPAARGALRPGRPTVRSGKPTVWSGRPTIRFRLHTGGQLKLRPAATSECRGWPSGRSDPEIIYPWELIRAAGRGGRQPSSGVSMQWSTGRKWQSPVSGIWQQCAFRHPGGPVHLLAFPAALRQCRPDAWISKRPGPRVEAGGCALGAGLGVNRQKSGGT